MSQASIKAGLDTIALTLPMADLADAAAARDALATVIQNGIEDGQTGGAVPATRTISTTAPLAGGGDLSTDRTLSIPAATTEAGGYMTTTQVAALADRIPASLATALDLGIYSTGVGAWGTYAITSYGRSLAATLDAAAAKLALSLSKSDVGLSNVDNTSDVAKPVSTLQATADGLRLLKSGDGMMGPLTLFTPGTGAPLTAPLYLPSGALLLAPEAGAIERLVDKLYFTITAGTRKPFVLADASLTSGRIPFTTTDGRLADTANLTRDAITGDITLGDGANLVISGGNASGESCIVFGGAPSTFWDSNVCRVSNTNMTMGFVCGTVPGFGGANGPFFGLRGNTFTAQPNQRGTLFFGAGIPSAPGALEGRIRFLTNDTDRLTISHAGLVVASNLTISDLTAGRVVLTSTGGRTVTDAGLTWAANTLGATQLQVGNGTALTKAVVYTPTITPTLVSAGAPVEQFFPITGLALTDTITVNAPGMAVFSARVSAAGQLGITFFPPPAGSYTPPAGAYRILAVRS